MEALKTEVKVVPMTQKIITLSLTVHLQAATSGWLITQLYACLSDTEWM